MFESGVCESSVCVRVVCEISVCVRVVCVSSVCVRVVCESSVCESGGRSVRLVVIAR